MTVGISYSSTHRFLDKQAIVVTLQEKIVCGLFSIKWEAKYEIDYI